MLAKPCKATGIQYNDNILKDDLNGLGFSSLLRQNLEIESAKWL